MAGNLWVTVLIVVTFTHALARVGASFDTKQGDAQKLQENDNVIEKLQESIMALSEMLIRQDTTIYELTNKVNTLETKMTLLEDTKVEIQASSERETTKIIKGKTTSESVAKRHAGTNGIAFFASASYHQQNLGAGQHLVFDHIITNDGNAYNPGSGSFTAPVNGIYVLSATLLCFKNVEAHFRVLRNGGVVVHLYADGRGEGAYDTAAGDFVFHLNAGETIAIDNQNQGRALWGEHYSFFSGFLLKQF